MNERMGLKWSWAMIVFLGGFGCGAPGSWEGEAVAVAEEAIDVSKFRGWESVGSPRSFDTSPALLNVDGNMTHVEVYGRSTDGAFWYTSGDLAGVWSPWAYLGGPHASEPAVTMFGTGRRALVGLAWYGAIYINHTTSVGGQWLGWDPIPGGSDFVSAAAVAYRSPFLLVVARHENKLLYWSRNDVTNGLDNLRWSPWQAIPGTVESEPSIASNGSRLTVVTRRSGGGVWISSSENIGLSWSSWKQVSTKTFVGAPAISYTAAADVAQVTARASDNFIWIATVDPESAETSGFSKISGQTFASGPASVGKASGIAPFVVGSRRSDSTYRINVWEP
jgi:hypothetical protein